MSYARFLSITALLFAAFHAPVGPMAGLMPEVVVAAPRVTRPAEALDAVAQIGFMPEVMVWAAGPEMKLSEVVAVAPAPEHLRGLMPEVVVYGRAKTTPVAGDNVLAGRPRAF